MILTEPRPSVEKVGGPMRERLAGFARTLRDNGFKVGLAETRDALAILTHSVASRPTSLRSAFRSGAVRRDFRRPLARLPRASDAYAFGHCGGKPDAGSPSLGHGDVARFNWPAGSCRASERGRWQRRSRWPRAAGGRVAL